MSHTPNQQDFPQKLFALRHVPSSRYYRTGYPREKVVPALYASMGTAKKMAGVFAAKLAWRTERTNAATPATQATKQKFLSEIVIEQYKLTLEFTITR